MEVQNIAKRLREARVRAGFKSAKEFAEEIGVSPSTYSNWERVGEVGTPVPSIYVDTVCRALDITADWLLRGEGIHTRPEINGLTVKHEQGIGEVTRKEKQIILALRQLPGDRQQEYVDSIIEAVLGLNDTEGKR